MIVCIFMCLCMCVCGWLFVAWQKRKPPSVLCNFHRSEPTMTTLIETLWRCKSANGKRQNNCPPTGPTTQPKKRGNLDLKEWVRTQEWKNKKDILSTFFDDSPPFRFSLETAAVKEEEARGRLKVDKDSNWTILYHPAHSWESLEHLSYCLAPGVGSLGIRTMTVRLVGRRSVSPAQLQTWTRSRPPLIQSLQQRLGLNRPSGKGWENLQQQSHLPYASLVNVNKLACKN